MTEASVLLLAEARVASRNGHARDVREAAGISQVELARALGVSQAALSRWEAGERRPTGEPAEHYARLLRRLERLVATRPQTGDTN